MGIVELFLVIVLPHECSHKALRSSGKEMLGEWGTPSPIFPGTSLYILNIIMLICGQLFIVKKLINSE
jgi:hypothetical protein